jgi:flagellar biosynthesis protein FliR
MTLGLPLSTVYAFLLVLTRVAGLVTFLPVPGFRNAPGMVRLLLALTIAFALFPVWPALPNVNPALGQLFVWAFSEAGFGLTAGLAIGLLTEGFQVAAQVAGFQAGYGFASTIDPTSQADSSILQVLASLGTGLLFFTTGLDRQLIRVLAVSFEKFPAGSWAPASANLDGILRLGGEMFSTGLRLGLPVVAVLLLIDLALALLGRVQQQLHLLSLAFPAKMVTALVLLAALAPVVPRMFAASAERTLAALWRSLGA